jgi:hypothetical protein
MKAPRTLRYEKPAASSNAACSGVPSRGEDLWSENICCSVDEEIGLIGLRSVSQDPTADHP